MYSPITIIFSPRHSPLPCLTALPCLTINTLLFWGHYVNGCSTGILLTLDEFWCLPMLDVITVCVPHMNGCSHRENPIEAAKFIGSSLFSDKVLVVGGKAYHVHCEALALHSGFFKAILMPSFTSREVQSPTFELHLPEPEFFETMLHFLYTGQFYQEPTDDEIPPVLLNAAFLDCPMYITGLVRTALKRNWRVLLDKRLHLLGLGDSRSALEELQHCKDQRVAFQVLAHWSRQVLIKHDLINDFFIPFVVDW